MTNRHRTRNFIAGAALGVLLAGATPPARAQTSDVIAGMSSARLERLDEHFHRYVDDGLISGVVTYIVRHGQVVHEDAYGMADIAARRPMSQDSYFYLYSMTKPVTSVALLMLYE
jgi:CubicO group peptidase (beta-lactamase class C family)